MATAVDTTPLTDKQRELVERHVPLVKFMSAELGRRFPHLADEILSVMYLEACLAAKRYKPSEGGASFAGYLGDQLVRRAWRWLRFRFRADARFSPLSQCHERLLATGPAVDQVDAAMDVSTLLERLTPEQREVVERRYIGGELAAVVYGDRSMATGYRLVQAAFKTMRE